VNDPVQRLRDIVRVCEDASDLAARGRAAFDGDPLLVRAAKNMVTEIGEAAKGIGDLAEELPSVPWKAIAGMRDRTIHRYPEVDLDLLWDTIVSDLPELTETLTKYLHQAAR
jgi:uncharacterized protein with HEPN domain